MLFNRRPDAGRATGHDDQIVQSGQLSGVEIASRMDQVVARVTPNLSPADAEQLEKLFSEARRRMVQPW